MFNIFEKPWGLLLAAIIVLIAILMVRTIWPGKRHWWQWLLPAFLVAVAFGLDFLVQTDTEKINAVINTAVKAIEEENCDAIEAIISDNYRDSYHKTKRDLMYHCRLRLSKPLVERNIKRIVAIEISAAKATAVFTVRIIFDKRSYVYQQYKREMFIKIKLDLQKEQDNRWLISRAEILAIDRLPAKWQYIR